MRAYLDSAGLSFEGGVPGGSQKLDHGFGICVSKSGGGAIWGRTNGLVDSCSWTHDVCASEILDCYLKHLV
jgi:hypothetical protein